jgi:hypothetical protein
VPGATGRQDPAAGSLHEPFGLLQASGGCGAVKAGDLASVSATGPVFRWTHPGLSLAVQGQGDGFGES